MFAAFGMMFKAMYAAPMAGIGRHAVTSFNTPLDLSGFLLAILQHWANLLAVIVDQAVSSVRNIAVLLRH